MLAIIVEFRLSAIARPDWTPALTNTCSCVAVRGIAVRIFLALKTKKPFAKKGVGKGLRRETTCERGKLGRA